MLEAGTLGQIWEKKVEEKGLCDFLGMGSERKGRPKQIACYRVWNEAQMWVESQDQ